MSEGERSTLPELVRATVETAFAWAKAEVLAPGAGFVASAVASYLLRRQDAARAILRSELERASATAEDFKDAEQFAAGAVRYAGAARDQAADENLRLLAQAMVGLARHHEVWASDFLKFADILAPLSRDELILLGKLMAEDAQFYSTPRPPESAADLWRLVTESLVQSPPAASLFPSVKHPEAIAARSARSGLILPVNTYGGSFYELSPIGREMRKFVNIEAALRG
jgi:hypothetical protein